MLEQTRCKRTSQGHSVFVSERQSRKILRHPPKVPNALPKGHKEQNAAAVSKTCITTEGPCAVVHQSVQVPKWGKNLYCKVLKAPVSRDLSPNYTIQEYKA